MSRLIDELKQDHVVLVETLNKIKSLGIASEEGQKTLLAAKGALLAHLAKEDKELYPTLNKAAETDADLKSTLDFYAKDMDKISKGALTFFEKYAGGGSGMEFAKDLGKLFGDLGARVRKEESTIYIKYNELVD